MEITELLIIYICFPALICYLSYGCYKSVKDIIAYIDSGDRASIVATSVALFIMLSGIVLSACIIYSTYYGAMPDFFNSLKPWLRPALSIIVTLVILFFVVCIVIDLVCNIKLKNKKDIAVSAIKLAVALAISAYIILEKWKWIAD